MEVFSIPLQKRAVKIILVHNHPSGEVKASAEDKDITDRLIQVGRIMHVPVLDHLIITENTYLSFKDTGLLGELERSEKYVPDYLLRQKYERGIAALEKKVKKAQQERSKEMARAMKREGIDVETIIKISGLTKATINRLKAEE